MGPAFSFVKSVLTPRGHAGRRRRPPKVSGIPYQVNGSAVDADRPDRSDRMPAPATSTACRPFWRSHPRGNAGPPTPAGDLAPSTPANVPDETGRRRPPATFQNMGGKSARHPPRPNETPGRPPPECPETGGLTSAAGRSGDPPAGGGRRIRRRRPHASPQETVGTVGVAGAVGVAPKRNGGRLPPVAGAVAPIKTGV